MVIKVGGTYRKAGRGIGDRAGNLYLVTALGGTWADDERGMPIIGRRWIKSTAKFSDSKNIVGYVGHTDDWEEVK